MRGRPGGWPLPLRLARRDALRARGPQPARPGDDRSARAGGHRRRRGAQHADVRGAEDVDRRLGAAQARSSRAGVVQVWQDADPSRSGYDSVGSGSGRVPERRAGGRPARRRPTMTRVETGVVRLTTTTASVSADATETALAEPLTQGLFRLVSGRGRPATTRSSSTRPCSTRGTPWASGSACPTRGDRPPSSWGSRSPRPCEAHRSSPAGSARPGSSRARAARGSSAATPSAGPTYAASTTPAPWSPRAPSCATRRRSPSCPRRPGPPARATRRRWPCWPSSSPWWCSR